MVSRLKETVVLGWSYCVVGKQLNLIERHFLALCNFLHTPLPNCVGVLRLLQEICIGNSSLNRSSVAERRKGKWQTDSPKMTIIFVYFSSLASARACIFRAILRLFEIRDNLNSQSRPVYVFRTISLSLSHYILLYGHFLDALVWYSYCKGYVKHPLP